MTHGEYLKKNGGVPRNDRVRTAKTLPEPGKVRYPRCRPSLCGIRCWRAASGLDPYCCWRRRTCWAAAKSASVCACALEMMYIFADSRRFARDGRRIMRRGKPTNHIVFGDGQAILAGDGLLTYAFECVLGDAVKRGGEAALREMRALERIASAAGCGGMVAGQCADLACERAGEDGYKGIVKPNVDASAREMLAYIHERKTARMIMAAFEAACELAGAGEDTRMKLMLCRNAWTAVPGGGRLSGRMWRQRGAGQACGQGRRERQAYLHNALRRGAHAHDARRPQASGGRSGAKSIIRQRLSSLCAGRNGVPRQITRGSIGRV